MTGSSPSLDGLAGPPSRVTGLVAALTATAMMLIGVVLVPTLLEVPIVDGVPTPSVDDTRVLLLGNVLAFLGFVPLLTAVHALIGRRAQPVGLLLGAYLVLLIRPLALVAEAIALPGSVLLPLGPLVPWVLLATTGVAAALAGAAVLPLAQSAVSPGRRAAVAAGVGLLVALALYSFAPYTAPLSALGVAVALLIRSGRFDQKNGPAGQS
ncbi:hypothetical protein [Microcella humidisoli]|uniref:DUF4386 family protein n=1 Tax=Microcella humidisoli TaxID=2963406 RepID=A0ABY5FXM6_9MICO|nr:hypothetical protein [Microcella humidisoli]UTT63054.1 hypothetical protein NNL39_02785 [Microcella humidisoli]